MLASMDILFNASFTPSSKEQGPIKQFCQSMSSRINQIQNVLSSEDSISSLMYKAVLSPQ